MNRVLTIAMIAGVFASIAGFIFVAASPNLSLGVQVRLLLMALCVLGGIGCLWIVAFLNFWVKCDPNEVLLMFGNDKKTRKLRGNESAYFFPRTTKFTKLPLREFDRSFDYYNDESRFFTSKDLIRIKVRGSYVYKIGSDDESLECAAKNLADYTGKNIENEFHLPASVEAALSSTIGARNFTRDMIANKDELTDAAKRTLEDILSKQGLELISFDIHALDDQSETAATNEAAAARETKDWLEKKSKERERELIEQDRLTQTQRLEMEEDEHRFQREQKLKEAENEADVQKSSLAIKRNSMALDAEAANELLRVELTRMQQNEQHIQGDLDYQIQLKRLAALENISKYHSETLSEALKTTETTIIADQQQSQDILGKHIQATGLAEFINTLLGSLKKNDDIKATANTAADFMKSFASKNGEQAAKAKPTPSEGWNGDKE